MTKYKDIAAAFGTFRSQAVARRDEIDWAARQLAYTIAKVGEIPDGQFGFAPATEEFEKDRNYSSREATAWNDGGWDVHFFLRVRQGEDLFPSDLHLFFVKLVPQGENFKTTVSGAETDTEKVMDPHNEASLNECAEELLGGFLAFYNDLTNNPLPAPKSNETRVIEGFGRERD
jgi:hypothetical protein